MSGPVTDRPAIDMRPGEAGDGPAGEGYPRRQAVQRGKRLALNGSSRTPRAGLPSPGSCQGRGHQKTASEPSWNGAVLTVRSPENGWSMRTVTSRLKPTRRA